MDVLVMLVARVDHSCFAHKAVAAFPRISPDRLQFFEYESVTVSCEEFSSLTEWRVMTKLNKIISANWDSSPPSCTINRTYEIDSGEYWCEDAEGQTSGVLNISVTAGSVILDFPARPVIEESDVILHCREEGHMCPEQVPSHIYLKRVSSTLLFYQSTKCAAFPHVLPNRLQFFEYEFISFNCEFGGSAEWRVMRTLREITPTNISNWEASAGSGAINPAFSSDSGEYWCEDGDGRRSNALNISVTAGSVILESPVHVTEGDHVTLKCQKKKDSGHPIAEYYKDGLRIKTVYDGNMTIFNVSASDEGLYKCYIIGAEESPESWLAVRGSFEDAHAGHSPNLLTLLSLLTLLLLVLGVCRKHKEPKVPEATTKPRLPEESAVYSTVYYRKRVL